MNKGATEHPTNPSLLLRLRNVEDRHAWTLFVEIYGPLIYSYCIRRKLQSSDAADVSQEVFAIVSKAISTFDYQAERGRFRDWLGLITHRELIRFWKRKEREHRLQSPTGQWDVESAHDRKSWDDHFHSELLQQALKRIQTSFELDTWSIFERVWVQGEEASQVAASLGIRVGSVYVAKSRVLSRLRSEILMMSEDWPVSEKASE